jgi:hypothetical protein
MIELIRDSVMQQNFLPQNGFAFSVDRLPNISFFAQTANIPGVSKQFTEVLTPFKTIYRPGDRLTYDDLTLTIRSDENMEAFLEIFNWMTALARVEGFANYKSLSAEQGLYSDASLMIMNTKKNPKIQFTFEELFPIQLGQMTMDSSATDLTYATFDVTFKYTGYTIKTL